MIHKMIWSKTSATQRDSTTKIRRRIGTSLTFSGTTRGQIRWNKNRITTLDYRHPMLIKISMSLVEIKHHIPIDFEKKITENIVQGSSFEYSSLVRNCVVCSLTFIIRISCCSRIIGRRIYFIDHRQWKSTIEEQSIDYWKEKRILFFKKNLHPHKKLKIF